MYRIWHETHNISVWHLFRNLRNKPSHKIPGRITRWFLTMKCWQIYLSIYHHWYWDHLYCGWDHQWTALIVQWFLGHVWNDPLDYPSEMLKLLNCYQLVWKYLWYCCFFLLKSNLSERYELYLYSMLGALCVPRKRITRVQTNRKIEW